MPDISWRRETDRTRLVHLSSNSKNGNNGTEALVSSSSTLPYLSSSDSHQTKNNNGDIHSETHTVRANQQRSSLNAASHQDADNYNNVLDNNDNYRSSNNGNKTIIVQGQYLNITRVDRRDMGFYVCIASNGVPTSVSRRIFLPVSCKYNLNLKLIIIRYSIYQQFNCIFKHLYQSQI